VVFLSTNWTLFLDRKKGGAYYFHKYVITLTINLRYGSTLQWQNVYPDIHHEAFTGMSTCGGFFVLSPQFKMLLPDFVWILRQPIPHRGNFDFFDKSNQARMILTAGTSLE